MTFVHTLNAVRELDMVKNTLMSIDLLFKRNRHERCIDFEGFTTARKFFFVDKTFFQPIRSFACFVNPLEGFHSSMI